MGEVGEKEYKNGKENLCLKLALTGPCPNTLKKFVTDSPI